MLIRFEKDKAGHLHHRVLRLDPDQVTRRPYVEMDVESFHAELKFLEFAGRGGRKALMMVTTPGSDCPFPPGTHLWMDLYRFEDVLKQKVFASSTVFGVWEFEEVAGRDGNHTTLRHKDVP